MISNIATFITYQDIYKDETPNIKNISNFFHSIPTKYLIQALCKLNIALWKKNDDISLQIKVSRLFFSNEEIKNIRKALNKNIKQLPFIFHRRQLLLAIKICLLNPNLSEKKVIDLKSLGKYLLAINQYLLDIEKPQLELSQSLEFEYIRESLAKLFYFTHYGDFIHNFSRAIELWLNIPKTKRGKKLLKPFKININKEFKDITKIELEDYILFNFFNLNHLFELDVYTPDPRKFMLFNDLFSKTKLTKKMITDLYRPISQDISEFKNNYLDSIKTKFKNNDIFDSNFFPLIEHPIIKISDTISIVSDPNYLEKRITEGPYWILLNRYYETGEIKQGRGRLLSSYFGILHQEYVYQSLTHLCDEVIELPASKKEKLCDFIGIVRNQENIYLVVTDAKKIAISIQMEINADRSETIKNLKEIFYDKGFRQIFNTIKIIQNSQLKEFIENKIDISKVKGIFPLLITDRFIVDDKFNRNLYEKEFFIPLINEMQLKASPQIMQPLFISAEELDKIESICQKETKMFFIDILGIRHNLMTKRKDISEPNQFIPGMTIVGLKGVIDDLEPFWNYLIRVKGGKYRNRRLKKIFEDKLEVIKKKLFKEGP
jgi:hypothetical protein